MSFSAIRRRGYDDGRRGRAGRNILGNEFQIPASIPGTPSGQNVSSYLV